jgi:hypothetical protein
LHPEEVIGVLEGLHVLVGALNALNLVEDLLEALEVIALDLVLQSLQLLSRVRERADQILLFQFLLLLFFLEVVDGFGEGDQGTHFLLSLQIFRGLPEG